MRVVKCELQSDGPKLGISLGLGKLFDLLVAEGANTP